MIRENCLPEPHSEKQRMIMMAPFMTGLQELWVSCGTKFGKTIAGTGAYCAIAPVIKDGIIRHVAPIYSQARIGLRYAQRMLPPKPYTNINLSGPRITFSTSDQMIEYWHAQQPENLEGDGILMYLLDETSKMKRQVYDSAKTTQTMTRGLLIATSTPRGKGWHYHKCMEAKAEMEWCLRKGIPPTKIYLTAPTADNPYIPRQSIIDAKKNLPDRLFRQYYLAEFMDEGQVFPFFRDALFGEPMLFDMDSQLWVHGDCKEMKNVVVGADWGKKEDYCVFTAWNANKREMVGFMRFRGVDYVSAIRNLMWFCAEFMEVNLVRHDRTGLGEVMDDALSGTDLPFEGITFTNRSKSEMVNMMMLSFQRKDIHVPRWPAMIEELDSYEVKFTEIGNMTYSAADGFHDDIVSSMILGWSAVEEYSPNEMEIMTLDQLTDLELEKPDFQTPDEDFNTWMGRT